jgi:hypothetical protein
MGAVSFIENLDRTELTITDEEFERNVEQAVSAIAEKNRTEEYEQKTHSTPPTGLGLLNEKSALSRPEVTPRNSMDAEQSSPKRNAHHKLNEKTSSQQAGQGEEDDMDAVTGLLRSIQKPLSSIGRIFSDDGGSSSQQNMRPASTPLPGSKPRGLSPSPRLDRTPSGRRNNNRPSNESQRSRTRVNNAEDSAARQASAEQAQAQSLRAREHQVVVE